MLLTKEECCIIADFYASNRAALDNTSRKQTTLAMVRQLYQQLTDTLNAASTTKKTVDQVREKLKGLKQTAKGALATGGGLAEDIWLSNAEEIISSQLQGTLSYAGVPGQVCVESMSKPTAVLSSLLRFEGANGEDEVQSAVRLRDYYSVVVEQFKDFKLLRAGMREQRVPVAMGLVPPPEELEADRELKEISRMCDGPTGLKRYLGKLLSSRAKDPQEEPAHSPYNPVLDLSFGERNSEEEEEPAAMMQPSTSKVPYSR